MKEQTHKGLERMLKKKKKKKKKKKRKKKKKKKKKIPANYNSASYSLEAVENERVLERLRCTQFLCCTLAFDGSQRALTHTKIIFYVIKPLVFLNEYLIQVILND